jgi:hypothetical protein
MDTLKTARAILHVWLWCLAAAFLVILVSFVVLVLM